ncbi:MAG: hypothetical protein HYS13_09275 [Planctomycetia bacterium]|nr:hypothetical protein [Planctomycetia bacterium]
MDDAGLVSPSPSGGRGAIDALCYYVATSAVVFGAIVFGAAFLHERATPTSYADYSGAVFNWDGRQYVDIARDGYSYAPGARSNVAFFPAYPLAGRWLAAATGLSIEASLFLIAQLSLAGAFVLLARYVGWRFPSADGDLAEHTLLAFGLWPMALFFRVAYTEAPFVLILLLLLLGIHRRWPLALLAVLAGLATATRSVGVAALAPLWWHMWRTSSSVPAWLLRTLLWTPVACWGIGAYAAFQWHEFGDPLAFARTQADYAVRPPGPLANRILAQATLRPIWGSYVPSDPAYWARRETHGIAAFSLYFANPLFFCAVAALVGLGAWKCWLTMEETLLGALLVLIPYVLQSYTHFMAGAGRHVSVAVPAYLVLGHVLWRMPRAVSALVLAMMAALLALYAALFAGHYKII